MEKRLLGNEEFDSFNYWSTILVDWVNSQIQIADIKFYHCLPSELALKVTYFYNSLTQRFISLDYLNSIYENHRPSRNICFEIIFEKLSEFVNAPILSVTDQILRMTNYRSWTFHQKHLNRTIFRAKNV